MDRTKNRLYLERPNTSAEAYWYCRGSVNGGFQNLTGSLVTCSFFYASPTWSICLLGGQRTHVVVLFPALSMAPSPFVPDWTPGRDLEHRSPLAMSVTEDPVTSILLCPLRSDPVRLQYVGERMGCAAATLTSWHTSPQKAASSQNLQASRQIWLMKSGQVPISDVGTETENSHCCQTLLAQMAGVRVKKINLFFFFQVAFFKCVGYLILNKLHWKNIWI